MPYTQHQKRRHDYFKIGFAYCQWGTGSPLPLWRPICCRHSPRSDNKQWPRALVILQLVDLKNSGTIDGYICEPLYRVKKKGAKFNWSTEAQVAFDKIKRALTEAPVLQLPNFTEQFNLFTDASGVGMGAVLNQNHRPIAFASRNLNNDEINYTVTERECLAVISALNKFKTYFGSLLVKVITDHGALTKLTNGKNLSSRMIRWALKLSEFNIEWEHRPGVQNVVADVLFRSPVANMDGSQISCAALQALALNSREQLIREQREDPELGHVYRYLENPDDVSVNAIICEGWSQDFKL
ncbi:retrovirus-related Pol polyprotein from transposon 17.6 [Trichonephila clavipes]|nr:retrovirus-related Pol polyprotein from transposon 17.6 [Trichonephila clavipes]